MMTKKFWGFLFKIMVYNNEYLSRHNEINAETALSNLCSQFGIITVIKIPPLASDKVAQAAFISKCTIPQTCAY